MWLSRVGVSSSWWWVALALGACSGKTRDADGELGPKGGTEAADAGAGSGAGAAPNVTGGRSSGAGGEGDATGGVTTTGGSPTVPGGSTFECGQVSCREGTHYCHNVTSSKPGLPPEGGCRPLEDDCTDCDCLCPHARPGGQCATTTDPTELCLCGGEPGRPVISCFEA